MAYDPRTSTGAGPLFEEAASELATARKELKALIARGTYTIAEVQAIRRKLLDVVRFNLDPNIGHMPDKRHY